MISCSFLAQLCRTCKSIYQCMYIRVMSHIHFGFMTIVFEEVAGLRSVMMIIFNNFADTLLSAFTLVVQ